MSRKRGPGDWSGRAQPNGQDPWDEFDLVNGDDATPVAGDRDMGPGATVDVDDFSESGMGKFLMELADSEASTDVGPMTREAVPGRPAWDIMANGLEATPSDGAKEAFIPRKMKPPKRTEATVLRPAIAKPTAGTVPAWVNHLYCADDPHFWEPERLEAVLALAESGEGPYAGEAHSDHTTEEHFPARSQDHTTEEHRSESGILAVVPNSNTEDHVPLYALPIGKLLKRDPVTGILLIAFVAFSIILCFAVLLSM